MGDPDEIGIDSEIVHGTFSTRAPKSSPLTSGTGSRKLLDEALARLNDEDEWRILNDAVEKKKVPTIGKTLHI
jgi:hypothetical protein